jgi:hypothetical protein
MPFISKYTYIHAYHHIYICIGIDTMSRDGSNININSNLLNTDTANNTITDPDSNTTISISALSR